MILCAHPGIGVYPGPRVGRDCKKVEGHSKFCATPSPGASWLLWTMLKAYKNSQGGGNFKDSAEGNL